MSAVVFDVETVGDDFDSFDETTQQVLLKRTGSEEEEQEVKDMLGLSPVTGKIVSIAMLDCGTDEGIVFFQDKNKTAKSGKENNVEYVLCSEEEILKNFWVQVKKYQQFVTFNGRGFDCPYIMVRSAVHRIKPTRELMPYRYDTKLHIDLYDQFTFYGAMRRGFSLHMLTRAFGIKSPKEAGVDGSAVKDLFEEERGMDIARYCFRDVWATRELYRYWLKYVKV